MSQISEIAKYLRLLYKKRYMVIVVSLVSMTLFIGGVFMMPKKYQADSTVFIQKSVLDNLVKGIAVTPNIEDHIRVLRYVMLSRDLINKVLSELDVDTKDMSQAKLNETVANLQKRTKIYLRDRDGLFTVSIVDSNPHFAQNYINKLVRTYVEQNLASKRDEAYGADRFLNEQLASFKRKLDKANQAIITFRKSKGVFQTGDEKSVLDNIQAYNKEIGDLNLTLTTLRARKSRLEEQLRSIPKQATFSDAQGTDRIAVLKQKLNQLLLNYTDQYPDVVKLKAQIAALEQQKNAGGAPGKNTTVAPSDVNPTYQGLHQKALDLQAEIASYRDRRHKLETLVAKQQEILRDAPEINKQLADLQQQRDSLSSIYEQLLNRLGQSEVSKQMEISNTSATFRIVDPASLPLVPISPNMMRMIAMSIFGGLLVGVGAVLVLEQVSPAVMEVGQLRGLGLEVLAVVPSIEDEEHNRRVRRMDRLVYSLASIYLLGMFGLLIFEFLRQKIPV
ncbi:MAG TPA: XrtA system polysaccharide chain length determinant [Desulfuromonadales bacterium]|nr:XrtA system polysaccharide chain length determinant [Desulfuromonadales bacterium]